MADGSWGLSRKGATLRYPSGATVVVPEEGPIVKTPPPMPKPRWQSTPTAPMPRVTPDGRSTTLVVGSNGGVVQVVSSAPDGDPVAGVGPRGAPGAARSPKQIADAQIARYGELARAKDEAGLREQVQSSLSAAYWGQRKASAQYRRMERAAQYAVENLLRSMKSDPGSLTPSDDSRQVYVGGKKLNEQQERDYIRSNGGNPDSRRPTTGTGSGSGDRRMTYDEWLDMALEDDSTAETFRKAEEDRLASSRGYYTR